MFMSTAQQLGHHNVERRGRPHTTGLSIPEDELDNLLNESREVNYDAHPDQVRTVAT